MVMLQSWCSSGVSCGRGGVAGIRNGVVLALPVNPEEELLGQLERLESPLTMVDPGKTKTEETRSKVES